MPKFRKAIRKAAKLNKRKSGVDPIGGTQVDEGALTSAKREKRRRARFEKLGHNVKKLIGGK